MRPAFLVIRKEVEHMKEFIKGADISSLPQMLREGKTYRDFSGNLQEPLKLLKQNGVNSIRLRLWNNPQNVPESGGHCGLTEVTALARQVKQAGFSFLLDFHYSDWWADPAQQNKPRDWADLPPEELENAVYDFTCHALKTLKAAGACPDMVQVGNEIRSGMLFPDGAVSNWPELARLLNSGIRAVREICGPQTKVMLHLDQGGRYYYFEEWFDAALQHGVTDFDCIGLSYYPFWHGSFADFRGTLDFLAKKYQKPMIVAETAHAWRIGTNGMFSAAQEEAAGFPATPQGQRQVLELIMNLTAAAPNGLGRGIYYWEPMMMPNAHGGWGEDMGLFQPSGMPTAGLKAFVYEPHDRGEEIVKLYPAALGCVKVGTQPLLPQTVKALDWSGHLRAVPVRWKISKSTFAAEGTVHLTGQTEGTTLPAELTAVCCSKMPAEQNLLTNGDFADKMNGWSLDTFYTDVSVKLQAEFTRSFPQPPETAAAFASKNNFHWKMERQQELTESGDFRLSADLSGDNTTGVKVFLTIRPDGGKSLQYPIFLTGSGWHTYAADTVHLEPGAYFFGIEIQSPPIHGKVKAFCLMRTDT
jgi:arabinogalactan endo-1,4-beta-galactosidase